MGRIPQSINILILLLVLSLANTSATPYGNAADARQARGGQTATGSDSALPTLVSLPLNAVEVYSGSLFTAPISEGMSKAVDAAVRSDWEKHLIARETNLGLPLGSVYLKVKGNTYIEVAFYERAAFTALRGEPIRQVLSNALFGGRIQVTESDYIILPPTVELSFSRLPIAGEAGPRTPTIAAMRPLLTADKARAVDLNWNIADRMLSTDGSLRMLDPEMKAEALPLGAPDSTTGHRVPADIVLRLREMFGGNETEIIENVGLPISPSVWIQAVIQGRLSLVLVQAFERGLVTYNPSNDTAYRVQIGLWGQTVYRGLTMPQYSTPCAVTVPNGSIPPGEQAGPMSKSFHGNGALWTALPPEGRVSVAPDNVRLDGSIGWKFMWWRDVVGFLRISGRRLDAPALPLMGDVPGGYGDTGFQASGVIFPTEGCWEVTGRAGEASLTFVVSVTIQR